MAPLEGLAKILFPDRHFDIQAAYGRYKASLNSKVSFVESSSLNRGNKKVQLVTASSYGSRNALELFFQFLSNNLENPDSWIFVLQRYPFGEISFVQDVAHHLRIPVVDPTLPIENVVDRARKKHPLEGENVDYAIVTYYQELGMGSRMISETTGLPLDYVQKVLNKDIIAGVEMTLGLILKEYHYRFPVNMMKANQRAKAYELLLSFVRDESKRRLGELLERHKDRGDVLAYLARSLKSIV